MTNASTGRPSPILDALIAEESSPRSAMILGPRPAADLALTAIAVDSRQVAPGALFAALKGVDRDGADYIGAALKNGAAAVLTSLEGALIARRDLGGWPVPFFIAEDPRRSLALAAAAFSGAQPKTLVAATGTNGKTSVASFTAEIWAALGRPAAGFGTTGVTARNLAGGAVTEPLSHTTPEPITLHALLARLAGLGVTHAAMEASSHGLAQRRLDGATLAAAAFTNLSRDHLDYHPTAEDYAAAKLRLFSDLLPAGAAAVLNADDPLYPAASAVAAARGLRIIAFGESAGHGEGSDGLSLLAQDADPGGQTLRIGHNGASRRVRLPLVGRFQGWNALAAAGLAIGCGEAADAVFAALEGLTGVRGRMELAARRANGAGVFVDYAHTPAALEIALKALRPHAPGRLHVVFGAGGDRDAGKRPLMGAAAAAHADRAIVTDDNPRSEDPALIRAAVLAGCGGDPAAVTEVGDRAEAILRGVDGLGPGDALLIAGKGHELGQEIAGRMLPFDDAEQARAAVIALDGEEGEIIGG